MKVYYLVVGVIFWINSVRSQFFYSYQTPFQPFFPQTFIPLNYQTGTRNSPVTYNTQNAPTPEYRGFGYRTDFQDGATSTVFFVTGADSSVLRNFPDFTKKTEPNRARNLASDILDSNAVPDGQGKIQNTLQPSEFQGIFDKPFQGVVNFYSLPAASQIQNETTTNNTQEVGAEPAESVVESRFLLNDEQNLQSLSSTTTETPTTTIGTATNKTSSDITTLAPETETTTNQEDSDEISVEATTVYSAETTAQY